MFTRTIETKGDFAFMANGDEEIKLSPFVLQWVRKEMDDLNLELKLYAVSKFGRTAIDEAWHEYTSWYESEYRQDRNLEKLFLPWFVYSWQAHPEATQVANIAHERIASQYLRLCRERIEPFRTRVIETCVQHPVSFYQVIEFDPGWSLVVREMFTGEQFHIYDQWNSQCVKSGEILFAMRCPLAPDFEVFNGCSFPIKRSFARKIEEVKSWASRSRVITYESLGDFEAEFFELYRDICIDMRKVS